MRETNGVVHEDFEAALATFRQFLEKNSYSPDVIWVTRKEIVLTDDRAMYVKVPVSRKNEQSVRELFLRSVRQREAILLATLCEMDGVTCAYAWVPQNDSEADEALMPDSGIKMSVKTGLSRISGTSVKSKLQWLYLRVRHQQEQQFATEFFL
jgi:hypothetical protein